MSKRGINKVILVGNLGKDPEVRYMQNGDAAANFSIATSENWKDKNTGQINEKVEWHNIAAFGKLAEICGEYLRKGSQVYVEGRLQTRKWQDKSGNDRYTTEVVIDKGGVMQMLGGMDKGGQSAKPQAPKQAPQQAQNTPDPDFDDDIPF